MKRARLFSVLMVSALLVSSPKIWAAAATLGLNSSGQLVNNTYNQNRNSNSTISDNNNKLNIAKNNNPTLNIPSGNAQFNNDAVVADGFSSNQNSNGTVSVVALAGTLTIDLGNGKSVTIDPGKGTVIDPVTKQTVKDANGNEVRSLKDMLSSATPADRQALLNGLTASVQAHVQQVVGSNSTANTKEAVTETAFMMKILAQSVSSTEMSSIMQAAVTTLTAANAPTGTNTNTVVTALIEGAKQGGATQDSMVAAANTGAQANHQTFTATNLQTAETVNQVIVTTPVSLDATVISRGS